MDTQIVNEKFYQYKFQLDELLKALEQFTFDIENKDFQQIISNLRTNINEPFLFVVVGEVKSGKSSFINALLGEEICKVDAAPITDTVQQIVYGDSHSETMLNKYLKRITLPVDILKTIAIVDTPGTNTLIKHHEQITQQFIPNGDLIMFVVPAKNPHTQSSWDLLNYINVEWRKKVIFILQQSDLATGAELKTNIEKVKEYALSRNIPSPHIFATSAQRELENEQDSGFEEIREFIRQTVTGGAHYQLKLQSIVDSIDRIISRVEVSLGQRKNQFDSDKVVVDKVKSRLMTGEQQSAYEIRTLIERLLANYDRISSEVKYEFRQGLSLFVLFRKSFKSVFARDESIKNWVQDLQRRFEKKLHSSFQEIAMDGARHFLEGIRQLLQSLIDDLRRIKESRIRDEELFQRIKARRKEVIEDVMHKVYELKSNDTFVESLKSDPTTIAPTVMGGGILAIIGTLIMSVTHGAFFDVTGGILTSVGVVVAGGVLIFKKGKIIRTFEKGLDRGKKQFEEEMEKK
ncbi:GTP-binding protein, partial [candidate division KSB1 bacterium]|nr:GTP-binding protein [candidate division KSB1 bacterium]